MKQHWMKQNWLDIQTSGAEVGVEIWVAERLFSGFGELSGKAVAPSLKVVSGLWSRNFGESSLRWREVLPLLREPSPETFVTAPSEGSERFFDEVFALSESPTFDEQAEAIAKASAVIRALISHQRWLSDSASQIADNPVIQRCQHELADAKRCEIQLELEYERLRAVGSSLDNLAAARANFVTGWNTSVASRWQVETAS